jgi:hypothetical protein
LVSSKHTKVAPDFFRLTFIPLWKFDFDDYCKVVSNKGLIDKATRKLQMTRVAILGLSFIVWTWMFFIVGLTPVWLLQSVKAGTFASGIVVSFYGLLVYAGYTALLNTITPKWHVKPDYTKLLKSDAVMDVSLAPDARDGNFPIGTADDEFVLWKFGSAGYSSNLVVTGQSHIFGESLVNVFIRGAISAENDTVFVVFDSAAGIDFSWLRYNYSNLLGKRGKQGNKLENLYSDQWLAEFSDLPKLPNIVVVEKDDIAEGLEWLSDELERRSDLRARVPESKFPVRIVVILDWEMTAKITERDNGLKTSVLKKLFRADRHLKMNVIAIADPIQTWQKFDDSIKPFASGLEFFHPAQNTKPEGGDKDGKAQFVPRSYDIAPLQHNCKLWWKGASKVLSLLECSSQDLAAFVYEQAGNDKPETFYLWKCVCNFRPFAESDTPKRDIVVNL